MSCAACQARVEKAVNGVPGVSSCSVSLLTNSMGVEGTASHEDIIRAVENAGYGASLKNAGGSSSGAPGKVSLTAKLEAEEEALRDRETPLLKKRLIVSLGFLLVLMYFSMGHMMWGWPLPAFFDGNHVAMGLAEMLLCIIIMIINKKFFVSGFKALWHRAPNMDSLIALGSAAGFIYSVVILFLMTRAVVDGDEAAVESYMMEFYFESSAMILTLITLGKMLEAYSKGKTTNALKGLMELAPKTANVIRGGVEETISIDDVEIGDVFVVRPGENIPVDGIVLEGSSAVNEAALTGESIPADKTVGDHVSSATLNQSGFLKCQATRVGEDTTLAQIIQMVSDAAATKAPVAKLADRISGVFVPAVIGIAVVTFIVWMIAGAETGYALARAITVLVVSCPCALGLATPVAIMVGNGTGARNGILYKNAEALQETGNIDIIALDKTGTITEGHPAVTDVLPTSGVSERILLEVAASLEHKSEHPLALAVMDYAGQFAEDNYSMLLDNKKPEGSQNGDALSVLILKTEDFQAVPGNGLSAKIFGRNCYGGNINFIESQLKRFMHEPHSDAAGQLKAIRELAEHLQSVKEQAAELAAMGKTPLIFAAEDRILGIIAVADQIKADSAEAIAEFKNMGIHVVMLTGDNLATAQAVGREAGVDEVAAGVLPGGKDEIIQKLRTHGKVAMVGDGINDAPALTRADIGIAIGAGADVAIDAADVVLMKSSLRDAAAAIRLSRRTYTNIKENLFWALIYNTLLIPAAAGVYVPLLGITMNPMLGAAAMSLSSFCVVTNALRLNLVKVHDGSRDKKRRSSLPEGIRLLDTDADVENDNITNNKEDKMTKTVRIDGMMCKHCAAAVKGALESFDEIDEAVVSFEDGTAVITCNAEIDEAAVKKAIEDKEYTFIGIE